MNGAWRPSTISFILKSRHETDMSSFRKLFCNEVVPFSGQHSIYSTFLKKTVQKSLFMTFWTVLSALR